MDYIWKRKACADAAANMTQYLHPDDGTVRQIYVETPVQLYPLDLSLRRNVERGGQRRDPPRREYTTEYLYICAPEDDGPSTSRSSFYRELTRPLTENQYIGVVFCLQSDMQIDRQVPSPILDPRALGGAVSVAPRYTPTPEPEQSEQEPDPEPQPQPQPGAMANEEPNTEPNPYNAYPFVDELQPASQEPEENARMPVSRSRARCEALERVLKRL